ncbi:MAG: outer membrane lipoprotein carrier protein LolA [Deltaproteobacteria bacterium]|nr:outer membrane lipoprotein carrier protein LolA [Deltaproteobacteria bacterium]
MRARRRQLLFGLVAAALATAGEARAGSVDELLAQISAGRAALRTLRARFRQTRIIGLLATAVESRGELSLALPGRLRWELFPPDGVTYWVGPEGFAVATASDVTTAPRSAGGRFGTVLADLMVMLGGDLRALGARYELKTKEQQAGLLVEARPKPAELRRQLALLRVLVGAKQGAVQRIEIEEPGGDRSVIVFDSWQPNGKIDPAAMRPPARR